MKRTVAIKLKVSFSLLKLGRKLLIIKEAYIEWLLNLLSSLYIIYRTKKIIKRFKEIICKW